MVFESRAATTPNVSRARGCLIAAAAALVAVGCGGGSISDPSGGAVPGGGSDQLGTAGTDSAGAGGAAGA